MPFLLISSSEPMSALDTAGSGGTATGGASATGSGGAGGRFAVMSVSGGGGVGRAIGGFFFLHALPAPPAARAMARNRTVKRWRDMGRGRLRIGRCG
jgi:hypothetical protein